MLDIKGKKIAVLCDTEEKVREFYKAFGKKFDKLSLTCDYPMSLYCICEDTNELTWDSCGLFKRTGYRLITFDEFIKKEVFDVLIDREFMIDKLDNEYCSSRSCGDCIFKGKNDNFNDMSDEDLTSAYNLAFGEEIEIKNEDKKVNKFKVGDIVKITGNSNHHGFKIGENVKLTETYTTDCIDYYSNGIGFYANRLDGTTITCNIIRDCDMELIEVKKSKTITITTSDTITTLTDGYHTTTINRYYTDKHNERVAIEYVVKKYYDELDEIDRVNKMPKVGDRVKVVDNGKTHSTYDEWLIKNNVNLKSAIKWRSGLSPENGGEYIIKEIHKYEYYDTDLALIEDGENAYIINIKGLEVIK